MSEKSIMVEEKLYKASQWKEAHKLGWRKQQLVAAMKTFGFSELNINQVVYEFESEE